MTEAQWTEDLLREFLGREESLHLEYKSGRLLDSASEKVAEDLSKTSSAFANTEGGRLIVGIAEEKRGKDRVGSKIDGVVAADWPRQKLQMLLESNVHPALTGLRIHTVPLQEFPGERVAFVIDVPQGRTAHQAKDCRYYGRYELETKPLRDFDIRLRMERGKALHAHITAASVCLRRSAKEVQEEQIRNHQQGLKDISRNLGLSRPGTQDEISDWARSLGADRPHLIDMEKLSTRYRCDEYEVVFTLHNSGERTIHDFEVQMVIDAAEGCGVSQDKHAQPSGGFWNQSDIEPYRSEKIGVTLQDCVRDEAPAKIWPGKSIPLREAFLLVPENKSMEWGVAKVTWKVFLDDVLPITGEFNLETTRS